MHAAAQQSLSSDSMSCDHHMHTFHTIATYKFKFRLESTHVIVMGDWYKACDVLGEDCARLDLCLVRDTGLLRICSDQEYEYCIHDGHRCY